MYLKIREIFTLCLIFELVVFTLANYDNYQIRYRIKLISNNNISLANECLVTSIPDNYAVAKEEADIQYTNMVVKNEYALCQGPLSGIESGSAVVIPGTGQCGIVQLIRNARASNINILVITSPDRVYLPYVEDELSKLPIIVLMPASLFNKIGQGSFINSKIGIYGSLRSNSFNNLITEFILFGLVISSLILIIIYTVVFNEQNVSSVKSISSMEIKNMKWVLVICPIMMVGTLLLLYFFYNVMVWVLIIFFFLAASFAIRNLGILPFRKYNWLTSWVYPVNCCRINKIDFRALVILSLGLTVSIFWIVNRNNGIGLILNNILGVFLCAEIAIGFGIAFLVSKNFKLLLAFLTLVLVIDVLMVYIPAGTNKKSTDLQMEAFKMNESIMRFRRGAGESLMEKVVLGTAGSSKEEAPVRFKVPSFRKSEKLSTARCVNFTESYSLLGFGDIILPGAFIVYILTYAVMETQSVILYSVFTLFCYISGLIITYLVVYFAERGQPALVFLIPCTLIPTILLTVIKKDFKALWYHTWSFNDVENSLINDELHAMSMKTDDDAKEPI